MPFHQRLSFHLVRLCAVARAKTAYSTLRRVKVNSYVTVNGWCSSVKLARLDFARNFCSEISLACQCSHSTRLRAAPSPLAVTALGPRVAWDTGKGDIFMYIPYIPHQTTSQ
ncbi:hypothetical protein DFH28DRAFT_932598 [Melampsora americana]|nr:hypothetical protein DFH28DRAFT_932598 [Melampsora americana]